MNGFMIAAPSSGAGKTTVTLGLLRALKRMNLPLVPIKVGPDYIDPAYHQAASGAECFNLDSWAMRPELISAVTSRISEGGKLLVAEGMHGLFDGASSDKGSSADLASMLRLPVILVVDCANFTHSVAALVSGFSQYRKNVLVAGVIFNRVLSDQHEVELRKVLEPLGIPVLGCVPQDEKLLLPQFNPQHAILNEFESFLESISQVIEERFDLKMLLHISQATKPLAAMANVTRLQPLGTKIAIAKDEAFTFAYAHIYEAWRRRGAELSFFSPLKDERPLEEADAIYLPGGYPEVFAARLSGATHFAEAMRAAAARGVTIYGEGGGYMALGEALVDEKGERHRMLGLLPIETSVKNKHLISGYRFMEPLQGAPWQQVLTGHEHHYAVIESNSSAKPLYQVYDQNNDSMGEAGHQVGSVSGSFVRILDIAGDKK